MTSKRHRLGDAETHDRCHVPGFDGIEGTTRRRGVVSCILHLPSPPFPQMVESLLGEGEEDGSLCI